MSSEYQYIMRIRSNIHKLETLSPDTYPCLCGVLDARGFSMRKRLLFILENAWKTENQENRGGGYWLMLSLSRAAERGAHIARTKTTWYKSIILLTCLGMIERCIPTGETANTPYRSRAVEYARCMGYRKTMAFYTVPRYTKRQLIYAEGQAKRWLESGANLQRFTKTTVIDVFGEPMANRIYQDGRGKPEYKIERERVLTHTLAYLLEMKPYTNKGELFTIATDQTAPTPEDWHSYYSGYKATWERASRMILENAGGVHRRPTEQERALYGLVTLGWIIAKSKNERDIL